MEQAKKEAKSEEVEEKSEIKKDSEGSKKNHKSGVKDNSKKKASNQDLSKAELAPKQPKSPLEK